MKIRQTFIFSQKFWVEVGYILLDVIGGIALFYMTLWILGMPISAALWAGIYLYIIIYRKNYSKKRWFISLKRSIIFLIWILGLSSIPEYFWTIRYYTSYTFGLQDFIFYQSLTLLITLSVGGRWYLLWYILLFLYTAYLSI